MTFWQVGQLSRVVVVERFVCVTEASGGGRGRDRRDDSACTVFVALVVTSYCARTIHIFPNQRGAFLAKVLRERRTVIFGALRPLLALPTLVFGVIWTLKHQFYCRLDDVRWLSALPCSFIIRVVLDPSRPHFGLNMLLKLIIVIVGRQGGGRSRRQTQASYVARLIHF